ncbi:hypothetical protein [Streptomyces sp. NBC_00566]|uniref:hypothetical protein n=1 Tax=Streptomyces sp. NBC_00566 TaxID=2975778 RepID=UPI002E81E42A|nr:hypothetical protein [Streptomyces sp. NBC_00566]WUB88246.1 hypothetical protein OG812_17355 [Streptomyces sp. NBC_00566]
MTRLARLATGSSIAAHYLAACATAWVARGRRRDLKGWKAALGCWLRLAMLLFGLYLLWRLVRAVPALMWLLTAAWTTAAWMAGKPAPEAAEEEPEEAPEGDPAEAVRTLLLELIGEGSGVHLRTVLAHLQERGMQEGRSVTDMRLQMERLDIPVHRSVKVRGVPTWGVRKRDLQPPTPEATPGPSPAASTAA